MTVGAGGDVGRVLEVDGRRWVTYRHAAALLGVPVDTLRSWVHRGVVEGRPVGRRTWIDLEQAQDVERASRHAAAEERA